MSGPEKFLWGRNIGEGAFARVVHAKRKMAPGTAVMASRSEGAPREAAVVSAVGDGTVDVKFGADEVDASLPSALVEVEHLAVKIMEKLHIIKNDKVRQSPCKDRRGGGGGGQIPLLIGN